MNSEQDNNQIIQYLLGTLPENEKERFDELSFTDDEFAQKLKAAENDLIDRYIHRELDAETQKRFETYYLASPIRLEKLKFAEALQVYGEQNRKNSKQSEKAGFFFFINNLFDNQKMRLGFAAAAILLLLLGGLWIFTSPSKQPQLGQQKTPVPFETPSKNENLNSQNQISSVADNSEDNSPAPKPENKNITPTPKPTTPAPLPTVAPIEVKPVIASMILAPPVRGGNKVQSLLITDKTTSVAIQLQLETDDYKTYSISLLDPSNKSILQSGKLKAKGGTNKFLSLSFPAKLLADGFYTLSVSGINADGTGEMIGDYPFRSVVK